MFLQVSYVNWYELWKLKSIKHKFECTNGLIGTLCLSLLYVHSPDRFKKKGQKLKYKVIYPIIVAER